MGTLVRSAFIIGATALFAACGGSQPPIGSRGAMPQGLAAIPTRAIEPRILPGQYRVVHRFRDRGHPPHRRQDRGYNGVNPYGDLIDVNGTLYGTTFYGGGGCEGGCGTVYSMSTTGAHKVLSRFAGDGSGGGVNPIAGLINVNGTLYGTTFDNAFGAGGTGGSVYSVSTAGTEKTLYVFGGGSDGANPWAGLIAVNGTLYGTTSSGGGTSKCDFAYGCGTVYSISTSGSEKILYSFNSGLNSGGAIPWGGLIAVDGKLYGTTEYGGAPCDQYGCGVVFSITTRGEEKVLHSFGSSSDGAYPYAGLIDVKGMLYGTTTYGGAYGEGTVYSITTSGTEKVLHSFGGSPDGSSPYAGLIDVNGTLYGTTLGGGRPKCEVYSANGCGTVFALTP